MKHCQECGRRISSGKLCEKDLERLYDFHENLNELFDLGGVEYTPAELDYKDNR